MLLIYAIVNSHMDTIVSTRRKNPFLLPVALRLFKDPDKHVQYVAALILARDYPKEAESAGVFKVFPKPGTPID
jgi:hypothetical protein